MRWLFAGCVGGLLLRVDYHNKTDSEVVNVIQKLTPEGKVVRDEARTEMHVISHFSLTRSLLGSDLGDGMHIRSIEEMALSTQRESQESYFHQYIDHGNPDLGTFKQKFLISNKFYKPGGPIILTSGTKILPGLLFVGSIINLAKDLNAMVVGLEQRYYGNSKPLPDLETENLRYLTLEQSVKDIGRFVERVDLEDLLKGEKPRWVVVGGSYGGNLAAWSRLKFPELIYAGWISSAPMQAVEAFPEYDQRIGNSLDADCQKDLEQALSKLDMSLLLQKGQEYQDMFACGGLEPDDFVWGVAEVLAYLAQYSIPQRPPEISDICKELKGQDKLQGMTAFYKKFYEKSNFSCTDLSGRDEKMDPNPANDAAIVRQNFYIMCRETGHFQIAPSRGMRFRSRIITRENLHKRACVEPFGITDPPNVAATNAMFGGLKINVTRLAFTTGDLDPWFHLTLHNESLSTPERPIYVIKGGRHTSDFNGPNLEGQPPDVDKVRRKVFSHIKAWLNLPA